MKKLIIITALLIAAGSSSVQANCESGVGEMAERAITLALAGKKADTIALYLTDFKSGAKPRMLRMISQMAIQLSNDSKSSGLSDKVIVSGFKALLISKSC